ncbi:MAG TPA: peptidase, partial [Acidobacteriota bacterium]|nr:peptidase [Acidobacteriota bacterium]
MKPQQPVLRIVLVLILTFNCFAYANQKGAAPELTEEIPHILGKFPKTVIDYDRTLLNDGEKKVVALLIEASKPLDTIFFRQVSEKNLELREVLLSLKGSPKYAQPLELFDLMKGRWDRLEENKPFIGPFDKQGMKPPGAGFYPEDMTKEEFESWVKAHPEDKAAFEGLFTVIRREGSNLKAIPFHQYYAKDLQPVVQKLREAAQLTSNASLKTYLTKRADAFLNDDYFASDTAWIDLNSPIEVVIGPYEVYEDN